MPLTHAILKAKQRELRAGFPETMSLRVHRSISWIGRAEDATDDNGRFIFLWISLKEVDTPRRRWSEAQKRRIVSEHEPAMCINVQIAGQRSQ